MHPILLRTGVARALLAAALAPAWAAAAQSVETTPPPGSSRAVRSPGNADWAKDAGEARAKAAAQEKLVYYEFEGPGCGNCQRMDSLLYPAFDFEALLIPMVPVKISIESSEGQRLAERYAIKDLPSILITTPDGRLVFLMQGFRDAPDFFGHVRKDLDEYRKFARKIDGQNVATLSAEEAYVTGRDLFARSDPKAALPRLQRAAAARHAKPELRESALEGLAAVQLELGQSTESRKSIDALIKATKNPEQRERAELFRAQIPLVENKPDEALALYRKFEKDHPESRFLDRVRSYIARLEPTPTRK